MQDQVINGINVRDFAEAAVDCYGETGEFVKETFAEKNWHVEETTDYKLISNAIDDMCQISDDYDEETITAAADIIRDFGIFKK